MVRDLRNFMRNSRFFRMPCNGQYFGGTYREKVTIWTTREGGMHGLTQTRFSIVICGEISEMCHGQAHATSSVIAAIGFGLAGPHLKENAVTITPFRKRKII